MAPAIGPKGGWLITGGEMSVARVHKTTEHAVRFWF